MDNPCGRAPVTDSVRLGDDKKNEKREDIFVEKLYTDGMLTFEGWGLKLKVLITNNTGF